MATLTYPFDICFSLGDAVVKESWFSFDLLEVWTSPSFFLIFKIYNN